MSIVATNDDNNNNNNNDNNNVNDAFISRTLLMMMFWPKSTTLQWTLARLNLAVYSCSFRNLCKKARIPRRKVCGVFTSLNNLWREYAGHGAFDFFVRED